jgi:hypothetical protein
MKVIKIIKQELYFIDGGENHVDEIFRKNYLEDGQVRWEKVSQYGTFCPMSKHKSDNFEKIYGQK